MTADQQHEADLFLAYYALTQYLRPEHDEILAASPGDLIGAMAQCSLTQLACLVVAHCPVVTEDITEAETIVAEVWAMCTQGARPRCIVEMGMSIEDALGDL